MPPKGKPPSISETAFECPHCGVFTTQYWFNVWLKGMGDQRPNLPDQKFEAYVVNDKDIGLDKKKELYDWAYGMRRGLIFSKSIDTGAVLSEFADNLFLSLCYDCKEYSVWVYKTLIFPHEQEGLPPNPDMPRSEEHTSELQSH